MTTPSKIERAEGGHTTKPWSAEPNHEGRCEWQVVKHDPHKPNNDEPWYIAECFDDADGATSEANARLIAAAPELLSHLEFAVKLLRPFGHSAQVQAMEAVIAKAKTGGGSRPQPEPQGYDDRPEWEMRTGFREEDFA